jgi:hypothetical protein
VRNSVLTLLSKSLTNINLTDMETCYKAFRLEVIQAISVYENRFEFEPEITVKVAKRRPRLYAVLVIRAGFMKARRSAGTMPSANCWYLLKYSIKESGH